jgi:hypothetical protein
MAKQHKHGGVGGGTRTQLLWRMLLLFTAIVAGTLLISLHLFSGSIFLSQLLLLFFIVYFFFFTISRSIFTLLF